MAKPKSKAKRAAPAVKPKARARVRRPIPWLPLLLIVLGVFGFWVAPVLWDRSPVEVVFEGNK